MDRKRKLELKSPDDDLPPMSGSRRLRSPHGSHHEGKSHRSRSPQAPSLKRESHRSRSPNGSSHKRRGHRSRSFHESTDASSTSKSEKQDKKSGITKDWMWSRSGKWQVEKKETSNTEKLSLGEKSDSCISNPAAGQQLQKEGVR